MTHSPACSVLLACVVSAVGVRLVKRQRLQQACSSADWNHQSFRRCEFWGDPHFDRTFFQNTRVDNHQLGVIDVATSSDRNIQVQSFQCTWKNTRAAITIGTKVRMDGVDIYVSGTNVTINGASYASMNQYPGGIDAYGPGLTNGGGEGVSFVSASGCNRFNVNRNARDSYLNAKIRVIDYRAEGICGIKGTQPKVPASRVLFSSRELANLCAACQGSTRDRSRWPLECGGPNENPPIPTPGQICSDAGISLSVAEQKCNVLKGSDTFTGCIIDYCGSGGDDSVIANAIEEPFRQPLGHWWWGEGSLVNAKLSSATYQGREWAQWVCAKDKSCMGVVYNTANWHLWHTVSGGGTKDIYSWKKFNVGFFGCGWYTYGPLVFVVDKSISMGRSVNGGPTRDALAYNELELALNSLTGHVRFNVIYFSDTPTKVFTNENPQGTPENVKLALQAVKNRITHGSTNKFAALDMALDAVLPYVGWNGKILLLSDGQPTGKSESQILQHVSSKAGTKVPIDGIVVTHSFSSFMWKLTKQTTGMYRSIRW